TETRPQRFESAELPLAFAFFSQSPQRLFDNRRGPAQVEEPLGRPRFGGLRRYSELRWRFGHPIIPGNKFHITASLARPFLGDVVEEKILERLEQQRPKSTAAGVGSFEETAFKHHEKKILG